LAVIETVRHSNVLLDTGPLVAILHKNDGNHSVCVETLEMIRPPLLTCWPVLTEAAWLLRHSQKGLSRLFRGVEDRLFKILPLEESSLLEMAGQLKRFATLRPQIADLAIVHLTDQHSFTTIFTLDRRDLVVMFARVRRQLRLLPETIP
jgi:uncharacterized protein